MLIGREKEITALNEMLRSNSSELIAVYGRRRVGKTFLIRECYKKNTVFEITGYYRGSMRDQLRNFHSQLRRNSAKIHKHQIPRDWFSAFELLESYIKRLFSLMNSHGWQQLDQSFLLHLNISGIHTVQNATIWLSLFVVLQRHLWSIVS